MSNNVFAFDLNREMNPVGYRVRNAMRDSSIRYVLLQGGSSSGKSYSFAQCSLWQTLEDMANTLVLRKVGASISKTIFEDYRRNAERINAIFGQKIFVVKQNKIDCFNGARIDFTGLDDSEKIKGISNYKRIFMDELTEFDYGDWQQIKTRMRGIKGQQLYAAFNPISEQHWIKQKVFDAEVWSDYEEPMRDAFGDVLEDKAFSLKSERINNEAKVLNPITGEVETIAPNFLWLQSTYLNNFWVVGAPDGTYGYYDVQCIANYEHDKQFDPDYYRVYALGEWGVIRTGGEFLPAFTMQLVGKHPYDAELPIHVSVDDNVLPYITTTIWQYNLADRKVVQIGEVCAKAPNNTASKAARLVAEWLHGIGYNGDIYLHGDVTTKKANTIDDNRLSFFDKYKEGLCQHYAVHDQTGRSNPSVALSGEFANALMEGWNGWRFCIDESCKESVDDYLSVKKDANGAILKVRVKDSLTKQSYEAHGHCTDTMRYALVDALKSEYTQFSLRRSRNTYSELNYIQDYTSNERYTFVVPSFEDMAAYIVVAVVGDRYIVEDARLLDDATELNALPLVGNVYFESNKAFFQLGKELREKNDTLRIITPKVNADERIKATAAIVKERFFFLNKQDEGYLQFIECLLDYNGKENLISANICACAVQILARV